MRVVYRGLRQPTPRRENFLSREARGLPPVRPGLYYEELNRGVSVVASIRQVRELVRRLPLTRWRYAAVLEIPDGVRTRSTEWEGHSTVWAEPDELLAWIVGVEAL